MRRQDLIASTALAFGLLSGGSALAQATAPAQLEEVVITAQRRSENLQRAALAVSAVTGDQIVRAGITKSEDISKIAPSLQITPSGGPYTVFFLRGVGNFGNNAYADATVAFNYDGVYVARPSATNGVLFDLDRVEVLKGPQGTLYGRNATGGAINVITKKPTYEFGGDIGLEIGNYNEIKTNGALNIPLVADQLAARVAFQTVSHDGYLKDGGDDQDDVSGRATLRWDPSEDVSVNAGFDYFHAQGKGSSGTPLALAGRRSGLHSPESVAYYASFGQVESGTSIAVCAAGLPTNCNPVYRDRSDNSWYGVNAQLDWKTPLGTVTVIPAYRSTDQDYVNQTPGFPIITTEKSHQSTLEGRLASGEDNPLRYVVGAFYFDESIDANQYYNQSDNGTNQILSLENRSVAAFTQLTYALTDTFRVTGGVRYTKEDKSQTGVQITTIGRVNGVLTTIRLPGTIDAATTNVSSPNKTFTNTTGKVGLEWDVTPDSLLYASVGTGFKAGGFFSNAAPLNVYRPEKLTAYTIGSKNRFLDNRLQLNAEAFYWKYRDQQVSHFGVTPNNVLYFPTENIGSSTVKGVEVEGQFLATENTLLALSVQYLDANYESFKYTLIVPGGAADAAARIGCPFTALPAGSTPLPGFVVNCSGFPAVYAPDWTLTGSVQQTFPLSNGAHVVASVSGKYEGERYAGFEYVRDELLPSNSVFDASLTYNAPNDAWSVSGWVNNLTDEDAISRASLYARRNFTVVSLRPPRTYGLRVNAKF